MSEETLADKTVREIREVFAKMQAELKVALARNAELTAECESQLEAARARAGQASFEWVAVDVRLPVVDATYGPTVLVWARPLDHSEISLTTWTAYLGDDQVWHDDVTHLPLFVTHWQPLPAGPKVKE
jgi:hypothetical protein